MLFAGGRTHLQTYKLTNLQTYKVTNLQTYTQYLVNILGQALTPSVARISRYFQYFREIATY